VSPKRLETLKSIAATKQAEAEVAARKADEARLASTRSTGEAARAAKAVRLAENAKSRADAQLKSAEQALEAATESPAKERAEEAKTKAETKVAEANAQLETAKAGAATKADAVAGMREAAKTAEAARVAAANAAKDATARMSPVSVFISRQTQKLYVRQAFQPLFDTPVTIRDADQPIGTHIYTALDYTNDGADVRWSVVSMTRSQGQEGRESDSYGSRRSRYASRSTEPAMTDVAGAKSALDRVTIPKEAMDRIAEVVSPGSSVIISDEPISKETGKGTDFIVLMSGEPQGGIKIRRRPQPWGGDDEYGYRRSPYGRSPYWGGSPFRW
jgi:hypothetical protein